MRISGVNLDADPRCECGQSTVDLKIYVGAVLSLKKRRRRRGFKGRWDGEEFGGKGKEGDSKEKESKHTS